MNIYIHTQDVKNLFKRAARSLLLAYALLYLLTFWSAETVYAQRIEFQQGCEAKGGFITLTDGEQVCTRLRQINGFFQL